MARGVSRVLQPLWGADCRSTITVLQALGVRVEAGNPAQPESSELVIDSPGWDAWQSPMKPVDFGNSGTTARLLTGVFAATEGLFITCFGDSSLSKRPMGRVVEPLRLAGATITGRQNGHLLPLAILGQPLKPMTHQVDKASAQVKSALILAGLNISGTTTVSLPAGGRDHTEQMLTFMGAKISVDRVGRTETIKIQGPFRPQPQTFRVPGDPSSAAFFAVLAALAKGRVTIRNVLENPTRIGFEVILARMGVRLTKTAPDQSQGLLEPQVDLTIEGGSRLVGVDMEPELAPTLIDEIPILAVAAAFASTPSRFRGLSELRVKESNRLIKTLELIAAMGGRAKIVQDDLLVDGGLDQSASFHYNPDGDHRLAMAAAVAAKFAPSPCHISDPECVAVSFPNFFNLLDSL